MEQRQITVNGLTIPCSIVHTVIVGSGAASLQCADRLHELGVTDIGIVTERVGGGTSYNSGSDKQTYYKLSTASPVPDSPYDMAHALYDGGAMHGDTALIESIGSPEAFYHLVSIGVPFPRNRYGAFTGYKTDHDPRQRATSAGPYTSREMTKCLLQEVRRRGIPIFDNHLAVSLVAEAGRVHGVIAMDLAKLDEPDFGLRAFLAENVVFGVGGPGGLYKTAVYPEGHTGAIGLALEVGAEAQNLTESQYGLASTKFRWNVSGTYQQVIPNYVSTEPDGSDPQSFLVPYFENVGQMATAIFLKGYQWPFDPRKIANHGSSLIDVVVYQETVVKGRRVFMDFRENLNGGTLGAFRFEDLGKEAYGYLENSGALFGTPIERLEKMNPQAIALYADHGIDIRSEALEIAVCAQHNNGGLAVDPWWESTNIRRLFPVGEVAGTHGVYRPGGSALNAGQVGALRAAMKIAGAYRGASSAAYEPDLELARGGLEQVCATIEGLVNGAADRGALERYRNEFAERMTGSGAHIRRASDASGALEAAYRQVREFDSLHIPDPSLLPEALTVRHLAIAHAAYLEAIRVYLERGGGSRGSYLVLSDDGEPVHPVLADSFRAVGNNPELNPVALITARADDGRFESRFQDVRPIPEEEFWFETVWSDFVRGKIYD
jgi:succinate dehydrogenase/fumarate reductase flavoprotein subunit